MKVIGIVALILCIAAMLNSGPGVPTQGSSIENTATPATVVNPITSIPTANNTGLNPRHGEPGHRCDIPVGQPLNSKPTAPASTLKIPATSILPTTPANGLNPKHGEPGHRCDIAVGQPLNSKPSPPATPVTPAANTISSSATTNPTGVPPKLKPKHGQPFHRCDILVGQPLDSKPSPPAAPVIPAANTTTSSATITPTGVPPKLNPKHGQPFHRCDILVGQPLNSKPTLPILTK